VKIQDLLFIVIVLGTVVALLRAAVFALRHRGAQSLRILRHTAIFVAAYVAVVIGVSLLTPRHWIEIGEEQRFDDWALTVTAVTHSAGHYRVDVRVSNHARGRPQRASDAALLLVAADGRTFRPLDAPGARSLQSTLQVGESFDTTREFDVPPTARIIGLDVIHGAGPGILIIGDRGSPFYKRPLVRIE